MGTGLVIWWSSAPLARCLNCCFYGSRNSPHPGGEIEEPYDLDSDPKELNNLPLQADLKSKVIQMRKEALTEL
jgi:hypothetical protein